MVIRFFHLVNFHTKIFTQKVFVHIELNDKFFTSHMYYSVHKINLGVFLTGKYFLSEKSELLYVHTAVLTTSVSVVVSRKCFL